MLKVPGCSRELRGLLLWQPAARFGVLPVFQLIFQWRDKGRHRGRKTEVRQTAASSFVFLCPTMSSLDLLCLTDLCVVRLSETLYSNVCKLSWHMHVTAPHTFCVWPVLNALNLNFFLFFSFLFQHPLLACRRWTGMCGSLQNWRTVSAQGSSV